MRWRLCIVLVLLCLTTHLLQAQNTSLRIEKVVDLPGAVLMKIRRSADRMEMRLEKQTLSYLQKLAKQEARLKRKLYKIDSAAARQIFQESDSLYSRLGAQIQKKTEGNNPLHNSYLPFLDTLKTSLQFIDQSDLDIKKQTSGYGEEVKSTLKQLHQLQGKYNQTEEIKKMLIERKQFLKQKLSQTALAREFRRFEQQVYTYQQQVKEYSNILNDPQKLEATAIRLLQRIPAVAEFLSRNSELASLFRLPNSSTPGSATSVPGLQTRSSVLQQMQQTLGTSFDPQQLIQQTNPGLSGQLNQLKDKIGQYGKGGSTDEDLPGFKGNSQKGRPFGKRLEAGFNIQSVKASYYFPVTSDLAVSIGYRFSDRNTAGLGIAYKIGWGSGWRDIRVTHQGLGLRSFWDWRWKGSFWLVAGAELNYRSQIKKIDLFKDLSAWQKSAMLGISKKYKAGKKLQGKIQLLYDFLYVEQGPMGKPFVFRVGYNFMK